MRVDAVVVDDSQLARLAGTRFSQVVRLAETTSTNSVLVDEACRGAAEGLVVVADHQTAGRGRFDRRWESPPGTSLLLSVLARRREAELPTGRRHLAVAAVALAVVEASRAVAGIELALKWPNDVIAARGPLIDRKVAGVLAETVLPTMPALGPAIVVGAGVNVSWAPPGGVATCLEALAPRPIDRGHLLVEILLALDRLYGHWDVVSRRYRESCATLGREVTVRVAGAPDLRGTAVDVDKDGRLVVRAAGGAPAPDPLVPDHLAPDRPVPDHPAPDRLVTVAAGDVAHATMAPAPRVVQQ